MDLASAGLPAGAWRRYTAGVSPGKARMALFGGMFGGKKHPNLDRVAQAIQTSLGLQLSPPSDEIIQVIESIPSRELVHFENVRSVEGMQELFKARSIRAMVDPITQTVALYVADVAEIERELKAEHTQVKVLRVGEHRVTQQIIRPLDKAEPIKAGLQAQARHAEPLAKVPPAFEHLEQVERLCPTVVELFVKHGQLTSGDKEVLKNIRPTDGSLEARIVALERWQNEMTRRSRGIHVPKTAQHLTLAGAEEGAAQKPEEALAHRFDAVVRWLGKLIKAFEARGIKFHGKPVWLPR